MREQRGRGRESEWGYCCSTSRVRINKRKCNEFPNMLNCLPNKETNRNEEKRAKTGAGTKAPNNMCATVTRMEMEICLAETQRVRAEQTPLLRVLQLLRSGSVAHSTMPVIKIEVEALNLTAPNEPNRAKGVWGNSEEEGEVCGEKRKRKYERENEVEK